MLLRLTKYHLKVKYVGSKSVLLADTLSRLVKPGRDQEIPGLDVNIASIMSVKPTRLQRMQEETKADPVLTEVQELIKHGWPESMQELPQTLQPFWCLRDELVMLDGLVMKGNRILVPTAMREDLLQRLHEGHQGQASMLQRARRAIYWPKIQDSITNITEQCPECQIHVKKKPKVPERQISTTRPFEVIDADLMDFHGQHVLVSVDYFFWIYPVRYGEI